MALYQTQKVQENSKNYYLAVQMYQQHAHDTAQAGTPFKHFLLARTCAHRNFYTPLSRFSQCEDFIPEGLTRHALKVKKVKMLRI